MLLVQTEEFKFDLVSQFHFPFGVARGKTEGSLRNRMTNHSGCHLSHFLGQKHGFKEIFQSSSEAHSSFNVLLDQKEGKDKILLFTRYCGRKFHHRMAYILVRQTHAHLWQF